MNINNRIFLLNIHWRNHKYKLYFFNSYQSVEIAVYAKHTFMAPGGLGSKYLQGILDTQNTSFSTWKWKWVNWTTNCTINLHPEWEFWHIYVNFLLCFQRRREIIIKWQQFRRTDVIFGWNFYSLLHVIFQVAELTLPTWSQADLL